MNEKRGGTCILIRKSLEFKTIEIQSDIPSNKTFEISAVYIPIIDSFIFCIYRIPKSDVNIFFNKLDILLDKYVIKLKKKVIIVGDLNIDLLKHTATASSLRE